MKSPPATNDATTYVASSRSARWWPFGPRRKSDKLQNRWDSPVILWGGGGLILLSALLAFLVMFMMRSSGDDLIAAADAAYQAQDYPLAMQNYQKFLARHARHEQASYGRVRLLLAELRQAVDVEQDWPRALQIAERVLPQFVGEERIDQAQDELSGLLPAIMRGLVQQADDAETIEETRQFVAQAEAVMQLIDDPAYLSSSRRQARQAVIDEILAELAGVRREITQQERLAETLTAMQGAAEAGRFAAAHELARTFLREYPAANTDRALLERWKSVVQAEAAAVAPLSQAPAALSEDLPELGLPKVILSVTSGAALEDVAAAVTVPFLVRGAVYGVQARTGLVRWRRFVGFESTIEPLLLAGDPGRVLICDARHQQLVVCDAASGQLLWRLPCPSPPLRPAVAGQQLWIPCAGGEIFRVALEDGQVSAAAKVPLPLAAGAAYLASPQAVIVPATFDTLFVLHAENLECLGTRYLGHQPGAIAVPPQPTGAAVLLCENRPNRKARLHWYTGAPHLTAPSTFDMTGHVVVAPFADQDRALVVSDRASMTMFEVQSDPNGPSVQQLFPPTTPRDSRFAAFGVFQGNDLFLAEDRLQRFRLLVAQGRLAERETIEAATIPLGGLHTLGGHLIFPMQSMRRPQVSLLAFQRSGDKLQSAWRADIAIPAAEPLRSHVPSRSVQVITQNGDWFDLRPSAIRAGLVSRPAGRAETPGSYPLAVGPPIFLSDAPPNWILPIAGNSIGWLTSTQDDTDGAPAQLRQIMAESDQDAWSGVAVAFREGVLAPGKQALHYLDPRSGQRLAIPFVPPVAVDAETQWTTAVPLSTLSDQFMIATDRGAVYRVQLQGGARGALVLSQQIELAAPCFGTTASLQDGVWLSTGREEKAAIVVLDTDQMTTRQEIPLSAPLAWGPVRVSDTVVAAEQSGVVWVWTSATDAPRRIETDAGNPVGHPIWHQNQLWLAMLNGDILGMDLAAGRVTTRFPVGEPLVGGPVMLGRYAIAVAGDGTLCVVDTEPGGETDVRN